VSKTTTANYALLNWPHFQVKDKGIYKQLQQRDQRLPTNITAHGVPEVTSSCGTAQQQQQQQRWTVNIVAM
jgi:hypothetical protein